MSVNAIYNNFIYYIYSLGSLISSRQYHYVINDSELQFLLLTLMFVKHVPLLMLLSSRYFHEFFTRARMYHMIPFYPS